MKISLLLPPFVPPFRDFSDLRPRFAAGTKAKDGKDMGQVSVPTGVSESWAFLLPLLLAAHTQLSSVVRFFITLTQFDSLAKFSLSNAITYEAPRSIKNLEAESAAEPFPCAVFERALDQNIPSEAGQAA